MSPPFIAVQYDAVTVGLSFILASFASYVALAIAKRVRNSDSALTLGWWIAGSFAMGTGIWATHFVGMMAMSAPFSIGFSYSATALSWFAALGASATAYFIAARPRLTYGRLAGGAAVMGSGISAMHYIGMLGMDMTPSITWDVNWVIFSVVIAIAASTVALLIFFELSKLSGAPTRIGQLTAALVMATAVCGMHYSGMVAASFPFGSMCRSAGELGGDRLVWSVTGATILLLAQTLFISILETRMQRNASRREATWRTKEKSLQKLAFRDPLTGLPNRLLLDDRLNLAIERCTRDETRLALLFIDLDGFKPVNDTFGHRIGDALLVEVSRRLTANARATDTVARLGGDEFLVLLEGNPDTDATTDVAQRIIDDLKLPFLSAGLTCQISCSIGITTYPDGSPRDDLIAHADAAMYSAKRAGGSAYAIFQPSMLGAGGHSKSTRNETNSRPFGQAIKQR